MKLKRQSDNDARKRDCQGRRHLEMLEPRQLLSAVMHPNLTLVPAATTGFQGYTPSQIQQAYGFNQVSGNGAGQTIAIVDAYRDPNIAADLHVFDQKFGLADPNLSIVSQTGGSVSSVPADSGWLTEIALDVEWAHAMAPNANIMLVEANSAGLNDLMAGVNYAAQCRRRVGGVDELGRQRVLRRDTVRQVFHHPSGTPGSDVRDGVGRLGVVVRPGMAGQLAQRAVGGRHHAFAYVQRRLWIGDGLERQRRRHQRRGERAGLPDQRPEHRRPHVARCRVRRQSQHGIRDVQFGERPGVRRLGNCRRHQRRLAAVGRADRHRRSGPRGRRQGHARRRHRHVAGFVQSLSAPPARRGMPATRPISTMWSAAPARGSCGRMRDTTA